MISKSTVSLVLSGRVRVEGQSGAIKEINGHRPEILIVSENQSPDRFSRDIFELDDAVTELHRHCDHTGSGALAKTHCCTILNQNVLVSHA